MRKGSGSSVGEEEVGKSHSGADIAVRSSCVDDVVKQVAAQPWVEMEYFQLGRGDDVAWMGCADLGAHQIVQEHQTVAVQKLGATPANLCTISCCAMDPDFRFSELYAGDTDAVFLLPGNTEFDVHVPAGARTSYISFDQDELLRHLRVLDPEQWERPPEQLLAIPNVARATLEGLIREIFEASHGRRSGELKPDREGLGKMVLQELLGIVASSRGGEAPYIERLNAFRVCRSALGYVEDRLADDSLPTITDLCTEFGVSERTLQYGFQSYVSMSPQAYLRLCRLNRAHAALSQSASDETTVTEVATRFGFFHLGKFARNYRLHFGETPSKTLASGLDLSLSKGY